MLVIVEQIWHENAVVKDIELDHWKHNGINIVTLQVVY